MMTNILQELNKHLGKESEREIRKGGGQREKTEGEGNPESCSGWGGRYINF